MSRVEGKMSRVEGKMSRVKKCLQFICYHLLFIFFIITFYNSFLCLKMLIRLHSGFESLVQKPRIFRSFPHLIYNS